MTATEKQTLGFQTEVEPLLHLMTHSLYSNKEIFVRELISNASDAIDKRHFKCLLEPEKYQAEAEPCLKIEIDKASRLLRFVDNGIGMSYDECIDKLGTIAKSGTREFLASLTGDKAKDNQLIGQFGVGFYSAFMVAEKITVNTRAADQSSEQAVRWESNGRGEYTVEKINKDTIGTEVILQLKPTEDELLEDWRLRNIILKYSDHITLAIKMKKEAPAVKDEDKKNGTAEPTTTWETVNQAKALWTLPKAKITEEEYKAFYKHLSHDFHDPLLWSHNKVEGKQEYTTLLYIPSQAPFDLWNHEKPRGLKLYVKRVFIMDEAQQFLPRYLRFVKGVIDSHDLPLNISREILQNNTFVASIRTAVTKRVLDLLTKLASEEKETGTEGGLSKYQQFWQAFGNVLKEGLAEDFTHRDTLAKLLRFSSTYTNQSEQTVSLEDYVKRMKPKQDKIYYITAENYAAARHSPHLEIFCQKEIEVLLLHDRIDEWLVAYLTEFAGKSLQSVAKDADITEIADEKSKEIQKKNEDEFKSLLTQMQEILGDKVKEIRLSQRLTSSPACIVIEKDAMSAHMQRMLQATGQVAPASKPILELNAQHNLVQRLKNEQDDSALSEWTHLFLEQAMLAEGGHLEDPAGFVKRLNALLAAR